MVSNKIKASQEVLKKQLTDIFDDLYTTCINTSKYWGNKDVVAIKTIEQNISILKKNTDRIKGKGKVGVALKAQKEAYLVILNSLQSLCKKRANEMGVKAIPAKLFKQYIDTIKTNIINGSKNKKV